MGWSTDAINKVRDILEAAIVSGQPLDFVGQVHYGPLTQNTTLDLPYLWLYTDTPAISSPQKWVGIQNRKESVLNLIVETAYEYPEPDQLTGNGAVTRYPFGKTGDTGNRGIMNIAEDIMNIIEGQFAAIKATNDKIMDIHVFCKAISPMAAERTCGAQVGIEILGRFVAGGR
jgi:hypothetical protein